MGDAPGWEAALTGRLPDPRHLLLLGAILAGYGLVSDPAVYARSLGLNVNLWWGAVLLPSGAVMVALARRARLRPGR